jgi:hypothetical protein
LDFPEGPELNIILGTSGHFFDINITVNFIKFEIALGEESEN